MCGVVQSICHPFATAILKINTEHKNSTEHAEQIAVSVLFLAIMKFLQR